MADKKENSNKDDGNKNNDSLKTMDLLLTWYNIAKDEERSLGSRKVELSAYSLVGFSILISLITLCISSENGLKDFIKDYFLLATILIVFITILMSILFILIAFYIFFLNKYQRIYFIISEDLEKIINDYISGKNNYKTKITKYLTVLSPLKRFINEADIEKGKHIFEKWYKHSSDYSYYKQFNDLINEEK